MWKNVGKELPPFAIKPKEGQRSVWLFPRPPACTKFPKRIKIIARDANKTVVADTASSWEMAETASSPVYYIPKKDINMNLLKKVNRVTYCEWKGNCSYWDIILPDGSTIHSKAFGYERSNPPYEAIIDCVAFYADWADCYIDDEKVTPQPGGYYAGWNWSEIVGPVKGEPGVYDG